MNSWQKIEDIRTDLDLPIDVFASLLGITREHYYAKKRGKNQANFAGYLALAEKIQSRVKSEMDKGHTREAALMAVLDMMAEGGKS